MTHSLEQIRAVFGAFVAGGEVTAVEQFCGGNINQTYFVTHETAEGVRQRYVLQCLNRMVFPHLEELMENVVRISEHMHAYYERQHDTDGRYIHFLRTLNGDVSFDSEALGFWRLYRYIENAVGKMIPSQPNEAYSAGEAFGRFQALLADLPAPRLFETIQRFHDTRWRYENFEAAVQQDAKGRLAACQDVVEGLRALRPYALLVQEAFERGELPERVVHNDAKLSNVLLDEQDGHAVCVIDLDTCMPGLSHHDFGDLMRSICNNKDEDTKDYADIAIRFDMFKALYAGYVKGAATMLTPAEKALLPEAGIVLTLEVAVRFLADYLAGDVYFRIAYPEHNLVRARAQLSLAQKLVEALPRLHAIADEIDQA